MTTQITRRRLVPAELRLVELQPSRKKARSYAVAFTAGVASASAALTFQHPALFVAAPFVALGGYLIDRVLVQRSERVSVPTRMTVTPWGIVTDGPIPWSAIDVISHQELTRPQLNHFGGGRADEVPSQSELTIRTRGNVLVGECNFESMLEVLDVVLPSYAADGSRALALSFDEDGLTVEPSHPGAADQVLYAARALLQSDAGRALVERSPDGYRGTRVDVLPGAEGKLARLMVEAPSSADQGALAAAIAAELGMTDLDDQLCALVTSPNPVVAGVAKAAALRLGAHPSRAGKLSELHPFLHPKDLAALRAWVNERVNQPARRPQES